MKIMSPVYVTFWTEERQRLLDILLREMQNWAFHNDWLLLGPFHYTAREAAYSNGNAFFVTVFCPACRAEDYIV